MSGALNMATNKINNLGTPVVSTDAATKAYADALTDGTTSGSFTTLAYSSTLTGGTGVINLGSGQFYKDASGNVGIGTASPTGKTTINYNANTAYNTGLSVYNANSGSSATVSFQLTNDAGSRAGAYLTSSTCAFYGGANTFNLGTVESIPFTFLTGNSERMRIDSSGNLLVGTTTAYAKTTSASSTNDLYAGYNGASQKFAVTNGGTIFAVNTTISAISDIRYKENIRNLDVGLDKILALKPRLYDWKEGKGLDIKNARGFIAQEFEQVFPDLIDVWKDPSPEGEEPYKSVRQDLIPVLVKAIQELNAKVDAQASTITALQAKVG
jgi:hypothetical protein